MMTSASPLAAMLAALSWSCDLVCSQPLPHQEFAVDLASADLANFDNSAVTRCFGSSHAATAMRADWQRELTVVQKDLGVEFVRFHGLLDDDMSVVVKGRLRKLQDDHAARAAAAAPAPPQTCSFVQDQDFQDAGANIVNATSKEECCRLCYSEPTGLPEPCVAAVCPSASSLISTA